MLRWETEKGSLGVGGEMLIADTATEIAPLLVGEDINNKPKKYLEVDAERG